ncbi:MAG: methyltransferase domain-containing protein [Firmicutes bacterium]|nr:methyltransferase domain-containing protein [Bacillota bacterium]
MNNFTDNFIKDKKNMTLLNETMWGPNSLRMAEELAAQLTITKDMRVLDLGCGLGLTSMYLVKEFGAQVFATDLWANPTENYERFESWGIADKAIPIQADATKDNPFAKGYFDMLFCVGAYMHFGFVPKMLETMASYVKKGGYIAIALQGLKKDFGKDIPKEMQPFWNKDVAEAIRSIDFWTQLWKSEAGLEIVSIKEMDCHKLAWDEYLASRNPDKEDEKWDLDMMAAEGGKYYNTIQLIAKVK